MTQAEMIDNMYKHFDSSVSKAAIEKAFQKVFADITSICKNKTPVTIRSFGAADIPPGKRITFRSTKDTPYRQKTDTPANSVSALFHVILRIVFLYLPMQLPRAVCFLLLQSFAMLSQKPHACSHQTGFPVDVL